MAAYAVAIPVCVAIIHALFRTQLEGYIFDAFTYVVITLALGVVPVALLINDARRYLVVCDRGVLLGPTAPFETWRWEQIDLASFTSLDRFSRIGRELKSESPLLMIGSSKPWGRRGVVFRLYMPHTYPPSGQPFWGKNPRLFAYCFGTQGDPRRLISEIAEAAAADGIQGAENLPGLTEAAVVLTGRREDAERQLPRVMSDPRKR